MNSVFDYINYPLIFFSKEISSVPKLVNLDFMDRIAAEAIGEAVAESVN